MRSPTELLMMTAATIAGVALVLHLANRFGAPFVALGAGAPPPWQSCPHASRSARRAQRLRPCLLCERTAAIAAASAVPRAPLRSCSLRVRVWVP